jgi:CheY-like chemotaxis protein
MAGYRVNTASDGSDAMDFLRNGCSPDIMLLDMNMPKLDGATTVRMIRKDPSMSKLKIFAVTGYSPSQLGINAEEIGIDKWFQKPLNPESLLGELQNTRAMLSPIGAGR